MTAGAEMIGSLSAEQAAKLARGVWHNVGQQHVAEQLLYLALEKDKRCDDGLMLLARRSFSLVANPVAASLMEYALKAAVGDYQKQNILRNWQLLLFRLGLLVNTAGESITNADDLDHPADLKPNETLYRAYLAKELTPTKAGQSAFDAAHILLGVQCGLIRHKQLGDSLTPDQFDECYHPDRFENKEDYAKFLGSTELEVAVNQV